MVARGLSAGLSIQDLDGIRTTLASGRKPKVVFTEAAGQIAGQAGQVVALRDPTDDEWVVVRFGRDELPFSPIDLAVPQRASVRRASRPVRPPDTTVAQPHLGARPHLGAQPHLGTVAHAGNTPHVGAAQSVGNTPHVAAPSVTDIPPQRQEIPMPSTTSSTVDAIVAAQPVNASAGASGRPARKATSPRLPKVRATPTLTVTLSYTDGDWFVGAQQGSKSLAKPYVIKAGEALRMVGLLDVPGVHDAVEQIIAAERAEANAHAQRLRNELAAIEARLADLPKLA
jgi:hypothetical protein